MNALSLARNVTLFSGNYCCHPLMHSDYISSIFQRQMPVQLPRTFVPYNEQANFKKFVMPDLRIRYKPAKRRTSMIISVVLATALR